MSLYVVWPMEVFVNVDGLALEKFGLTSVCGNKVWIVSR